MAVTFVHRSLADGRESRGGSSSLLRASIGGGNSLSCRLIRWDLPYLGKDVAVVYLDDPRLRLTDHNKRRRLQPRYDDSGTQREQLQICGWDRANDEIASRIGSVRDVVSRAFARLKHDGLITMVDRDLTIVDLQGLKLYSTGARRSATSSRIDSVHPAR
jgi:hypothetical protein